MDSFPPERPNTPTAVSGPRPRKRHRALRAFACTLLTLVALAALACILAAIALRHSMRASLPQLDGTIHVAGLAAPVTVTRDPQGVPSIHAATLDDLLFAQGYITAQDRLWQMDALRRAGAGDLAELLGPSLVDHDRQQRILQLRNAADAAVVAMPADQRHQYDAYARGVNAFIDTHQHSLPVEFTLLHYKPAPWQPRDSILVLLAMWQDLATTFPQKMDREALAAHLPVTLIADLYPIGSFRDHPPGQPTPDLTTPKQEIEQIPLDSTQSSLHTSPRDLLHRFQAATHHYCDGCRAGSNNWVVAGTHSASGAPLLSNDMHLDLNVPDIWYEAKLHTPDHSLDVAGFTLPGLPFVLAGRNAHVAWGFTAMGADVQDIYIEHLRGSGEHAEFQRLDGTWSAVAHHNEHIRVRGGRDITLDVLTTTHPLGSINLPTPIISGLYPHEQRSLALAWTAYDPSALDNPMLAIDTASSGTALVAAFGTMGGPSLNLVYADDQAHIGYHALGEIPVRGPAQRHARSLPQLQFPGTTPDSPNQTAEPDAEPEASVTSPHLTLAAYHQRRHARTPPKPLAEPPAAEADTAPPAAAIDYTIGSPIPQIPVDALNASAQWSGLVPYDQLPAVVDPPSGTLATANARVTPDDYPYFLATNWSDAYRTERIYHLLDGRDGLTPTDMLHVDMDVHSDFDQFLAQRLAYAVDHASPAALAHDSTRLRAAANVLRRFGGEINASDAAPAITTAVRAELWTDLLAPQIRAHDHLAVNDKGVEAIADLYTWQERTTALEEVLNHQPARWLPPGSANWSDFLTGVLEHALVQRSAPADITQWKYGKRFPLEIAHPVLTNPVLEWLLGVATGTGLRANSGNPLTIRASGFHFGASERFVADLASPDATAAVITTGESGDPRSPHYLDQFEAWISGKVFAFPLSSTSASHTLTLEH
jgi:penicillin amidase